MSHHFRIPVILLSQKFLQSGILLSHQFPQTGIPLSQQLLIPEIPLSQQFPISWDSFVPIISQHLGFHCPNNF